MRYRKKSNPDMQRLPYRYRNPVFRLLLFACMFTAIISCKKETSSGPPKISFISDSGYTYHDTSLVIGGRIKVGVKASAVNGNITFFQVSCNNGKKQILLDSGLNRSALSYNLTIIKSSSAYERWTFLVMDRDRNLDSVQILVGKSDSSHYGRIRSYPDMLLGAQENTAAGSFLSFSTSQIFNLEEAYLNQGLVDLVYYYGQYESTLASPNEAEAPSYFTGEHGISNWSLKNETRYDTTSLTSAEYDEARNDSLLLAVYEPTAGKRKAKFVGAGMVISFKDASGKIGLIRIISTEAGAAGTIRCSVKIQE